MNQKPGRTATSWGLTVVATLSLLLPSIVAAELATEKLGTSLRVGTPQPHWTYYLDFQFSNFNGRFVLMDADDTESACKTLVDEANARGGVDNITVLVVHVQNDPKRAQRSSRAKSS